MSPPDPTPIIRFIHLDNLGVYLRRRALHAPNRTPKDGETYKTIHDVAVQSKRHEYRITCGPKGTLHDFVPFYFGPLSPMMLQLKTGQVEGYTEGQEPLICLASTAQAVAAAGCRFVFSDGHGIARWTTWYDDLTQLDEIDWSMVGQRYWADNIDDMDRQRRKQAEFLVHGVVDWKLVNEIVVIDALIEARVHAVLAKFPQHLRRSVAIKRDWYFW